jgi:hypothetical protein
VSIEWVCFLGGYLTIGGGSLCSDLVIPLSTFGRVHELPPTALVNKHEASNPKEGVNRCTYLEYHKKEQKTNLP